jgi:hypothetical protein
MTQSCLYNKDRQAQDSRLAKRRRAMNQARARRRLLLRAAYELRRLGRQAEAEEMLRMVAAIDVVPKL